MFAKVITHPARMCAESTLCVPVREVRSKIRLELRREAAGMHPPLSISTSYGIVMDFTFRVSDKIETKTARKREEDCSPSQGLYTIEGG